MLFRSEDFDGNPFPDILGILPISYPQFLVSDAQTIAGIISDYWTQRNVDSSLSANSDKDCLDRVWMYNTIKNALAKYCRKCPGDEILKTWTEEEWDAMRGWSVGIRDVYIPSSCRVHSLPDLKGQSPPPTSPISD